MKTSIKSILAAVALSAFAVGPASAMVSQNSVNQDIHSVIGNDSNVFVSVQNDTVTLSGYFADSGDKHRALQVAKAADGVERVIDNTFRSN